jgi:hypothetical protein
MRTRRWIGAAMLVGATLGAPSVAWADGGAYLDLDRTHYLPGQRARAQAYVSIPRAKQGLVERGPFYVFVVPKRASVAEGRPISADAVRVGTASIEREDGRTFGLRASFVVPDLPGAFYRLAVCNDPCTISGFREPLTGEISIVQTLREGELLTELYQQQNQTWMARRHVRKAERANLELRSELLDAEMARSELAIRVRELEAAAAASAIPSARRPSISAWATLILAGALFAVALALVVRRRRRLGPAIPDPIVATSPASAPAEPRVPVG